jgi:hypothetical protein
MKYLCIILYLYHILSKRMRSLTRSLRVEAKKVYMTNHLEKMYELDNVFVLNVKEVDFLELDYTGHQLSEALFDDHRLRYYFGIDVRVANLLLFPIVMMQNVYYVEPYSIQIEFLDRHFLYLQFEDLDKLVNCLQGYISVHSLEHQINTYRVSQIVTELVAEINKLNNRIKRRLRKH